VRIRVTAGDHIDWMTTSPEAMRLTDWSTFCRKSRKLPAFFDVRSLMVWSISGLRQLPLSPYSCADASSHHRVQMHRGIDERGLAFNCGLTDSSAQLLDLATDRSGPDAQRFVLW